MTAIRAVDLGMLTFMPATIFRAKLAASSELSWLQAFSTWVYASRGRMISNSCSAT